MRTWMHERPSLCWVLWNLWAVVVAILMVRNWHAERWGLVVVNVVAFIYASWRSIYWWERS